MLDARSPFQCARFIWNSFSSSSVVSRSPLPYSACLFLLLISFLKIFCHLSPTLAGRVLNPCWICAKGLAGLMKSSCIFHNVLLSPTYQLVVEGVDIPPYFLFHIRLPTGECQETAQGEHQPHHPAAVFRLGVPM